VRTFTALAANSVLGSSTKPHGHVISSHMLKIHLRNSITNIMDFMSVP